MGVADYCKDAQMMSHKYLLVHIRTGSLGLQQPDYSQDQRGRRIAVGGMHFDRRESLHRTGNGS